MWGWGWTRVETVGGSIHMGSIGRTKWMIIWWMRRLKGHSELILSNREKDRRNLTTKLASVFKEGNKGNKKKGKKEA